MFLSFDMVLSFDNAPTVWAILDRVSCFDPSSVINVGEWFRTTAGVRLMLWKTMRDQLALVAEQSQTYVLLMAMMPLHGKKKRYSS